MDRWLRGVTLYSLAATVVHHSHTSETSTVLDLAGGADQPQAVLLLRHMVWSVTLRAGSAQRPVESHLLQHHSVKCCFLNLLAVLWEGVRKPVSYSWISEVEIPQFSTI